MLRKIVLSTLLLSAQYVAAEMPDSQVLSKAFGHFIAQNIAQSDFNLSLEDIIVGMRDEAQGKASPLNEVEYEQAMATLHKNAFEKLANENLAAADKFMKENVQHSGIIELAKGELQLEILKNSSSDTLVTATSTPLVHYTGKYLDGTVFSSSIEMGNPIPLQLSQSIPGFIKGLEGAKEGEVRRLYIHPNLAYGKTDFLPPNSLLIFDFEIVQANVELLDSDS